MITFKYLIEVIKNRRFNYRLKKSDFVRGDVSMFFIVSAGRSGSTLLRKHLQQFGDVHIPPESEDFIPRTARLFVENSTDFTAFVEKVLNLIKTMDCLHAWKLNLPELKLVLLSLPKHQQKIDVVINSIYRFHSPSPSLVLGDKTPLLNDHLPLLRIVFPNAKVIYMIRDSRAVVSSYMDSRGYDLIKSVNRWKFSVKNYHKHRLKFSNRISVLKYENFIENTDFELERLLKFLAVVKVTKDENSIYANMGDVFLSHHENVANPITRKSIAKWKEILSQDQLNYINQKCKSEMNDFNYTINE